MKLDGNRFYGTVIQLKEPLFNCECWNSSSGERGDVPKGLWIEIVSSYDLYRTTILASTGNKDMHDEKMHQGGIPCYNGNIGYRFIVSTKKLNDATGINIPLTRWSSEEFQPE